MGTARNISSSFRFLSLIGHFSPLNAGCRTGAQLPRPPRAKHTNPPTHIHPKCPAYSRINDTRCYSSPCKVFPGHACACMHAYPPPTLGRFYLYTTELTFLLIRLPAQRPASPPHLLPAPGNQSTPSPRTFCCLQLFPHVQNPNSPSHAAVGRCRSTIQRTDTPCKGLPNPRR